MLQVDFFSFALSEAISHFLDVGGNKTNESVNIYFLYYFSHSLLENYFLSVEQTAVISAHQGVHC